MLQAADPDVYGEHICVHTVLLPCANTIAANLLIPGPMEATDAATTDALVRRVPGAFERAQKAGRLITHLKDASHLARHVANAFDTDAPFRVSEAPNAFAGAAHEMGQPGSTLIQCRMTCWGPTLDGNAEDPGFQRITQQVINE